MGAVESVPVLRQGEGPLMARAIDIGGPEACTTASDADLDLRDRIALRMLPQILDNIVSARSPEPVPPDWPTRCARSAYRLADAMLEARSE